MLKAIAVYEGFCLRMRHRFANPARIVARLILPKLKDKKATVVSGVSSCLDTIFKHCLEVTDLLEEFQAAMDPKNVSNYQPS